MKKHATSIMLALVICALSGGPALAKVKSRSVSFGQDFWVGGTLVKAGTYRLNFDDATGEVTLVDKKKATVAKINAWAEKRDAGARGLEIKMVPKGEHQMLHSVAFPGEKQTVVCGESGGKTTGG